MIIDYEGYFSGKILDHGVSATKNGYPQLVLNLIADGIYNFEESGYYPYEGGDDNPTITAYLCLAGKDKKTTLSAKQVMAVTGWDGNSFAELDGIDMDGMDIQFRVEENTYNDNTTFQVSWIDPKDTVPGRGGVQKLDKAALKKLDGVYGRNKVDTAKPPKTPPAAPPKAGDKKKAPPKAPKKGEARKLATKTTLDKAWEAVSTTATDCNVSDDDCAKIWTDAIQGIAPGVEQSDITGEQWAEVQNVCEGKIVGF